MLLYYLLLQGHQRPRRRHAEDFRLWRYGDPIAHYSLGLHRCKWTLDSLALAPLERGLLLEVVPTLDRLVQVGCDGPAPRCIEYTTSTNIIHMSQSRVKLISIGLATALHWRALCRITLTYVDLAKLLCPWWVLIEDFRDRRPFRRIVELCRINHRTLVAHIGVLMVSSKCITSGRAIEPLLAWFHNKVKVALRWILDVFWVYWRSIMSILAYQALALALHSILELLWGSIDNAWRVEKVLTAMRSRLLERNVDLL